MNSPEPGYAQGVRSEDVPGDTDRDSEIARKDAEWAAKADAAHGAPGAPGAHGAAGPHRTTGSLGSGSVGPAGTVPGHGGGTTPGSEPQTYRTPKNLRASTGPPFGGRGVLAVFGLLGVLLTIGIMVLLFVKVIDGASGNGDDNASDAPTTDVPAPTDGSEEAVPGVPGLPGGAQIDPSAPTDAARAAECETERATIEMAVAAYEILKGTNATSVDELIAEGLLVPPDGGFSQELSADGTVVGTGDCAPG